MKERPILFSGAMVRALLDGRKTVTRRLVKGDQIPRLSNDGGEWPWMAVGQHHPRYGFVVTASTEQECAEQVGVFGACPYGRRGDRLWVREGWQDVHPVQVAEGRYSQLGRAGIPGPPGVTSQTIYRADGPYPAVYHRHAHPYRSLQPDPDHLATPAEGGFTGWASSIHMPRWASRILLEITGVRIERLQAITAEQAMAEGVRLCVEHAACGDWYHVDGADTYSADPRKSFELLWASTGGDWAGNPWVWVVEFKRVTP